MSCGSVVLKKYGWLLAKNGENAPKTPTTTIQANPRRAPRLPTVSSITCASHGCGGCSSGRPGAPLVAEDGSARGCGKAAAVIACASLAVRNPRIGHGVQDVG